LQTFAVSRRIAALRRHGSRYERAASSSIGRFASQPNASGLLRSVFKRALCATDHRPPGTRAASLRYENNFGGKMSKQSHGVRIKRSHALGPFGGDELRDRSAGVVRDQRGALDPERVEKIAHDRREAGRGEVRSGTHRHVVRAQRQIGRNTAVRPRERRDDVAPEVRVHEQPVQEHERLARATLAIAQRALRQLHLMNLTEVRRT
jgi:hypothetical protein